jgi:serine phosphatase RsbU (regulator of sigma subunit)
MKTVILLAAAAAGIALLAYVAPKAHPAAAWNLQCDRESSQVKAREISAALGVDTAGWPAVVTGGTNGKSADVKVSVGEGKSNQVTIDKSSEVVTPRFSPVFPKVAMEAPSGLRVLVTLSAAGAVNKWELRGFKKADSVDQAAATTLAATALQRIAGPDAPAFRSVPGPSETDGTQVIAFEKDKPVRERFEATVNGARLVKAELKPVKGGDDDDAQRAGRKVVTWLSGAAGVVLYFLGTVLAIAIYIFWAVRRVIRHRFVFALSATVIVWGAIYWMNWMGYDERYNSIAIRDSLMENFLGGAAIVLCMALLYVALAGTSDAIGLQSKMATLRSLFSAGALNRRAGASIGAGLLVSPLLAAAPLALSALRLLGSERSTHLDASIVYSAHPALQAIDVPMSAVILGLFGFGAPQAARFIRKGWLAIALLAVCGTLMLATRYAVTETSPVEFLLTGAVLFLVYWTAFLRFDVLAILAAAWGAQVLANACTLALQPVPFIHSSGLETFGLMAVFTGCAGLVAWRGKELAAEQNEAPAAVISQRESLMKEFSIAHRVQQEMLPERPPEIPGCTLAASCQPAQDVGGDLFDFLQLPDGRWTIGVGDVSGKGVPAALYMTLTKGLLIATTQDSSDIADIIGHVNRHVHAATEKKTFVTMALGAFDPETRTFEHVRAGHNPVVWRRAAEGSTSLLNAPGLGLGIVSDKLFRRSIKPQSLQLSPGDALVFYSDGLTEAMNAGKEQFGEERLMRSVEEADGLDAGGVRERIVDRVKEFLEGIAPQDDMTIVVLRVH